MDNLSGINKCKSGSVEEDEIIKILEKLQGSLCIDKDVFSAAAEAVKASMHNLLIKKQYSSKRQGLQKEDEMM